MYVGPLCSTCGHDWGCHEEPWPVPPGFAEGTWCGHTDEDGMPDCICEAWTD